MEVYYTCSWENHRNLWENMGKHHGKWRFSSLGQWSNKKAKNPWPVSEVACWSKACHPNPSVTSDVQVSQLQVLPPNWEAQRLALPGCSWHLHALAHAQDRSAHAKSSTAGLPTLAVFCWVIYPLLVLVISLCCWYLHVPPPWIHH